MEGMEGGDTLMHHEAQAYETYTAYCATVGTAPLPLIEWKNLEGTMKPTHETNEHQHRPRHHSRLLDNPQVSYLDLTFPSLHSSEEGVTYTVVGPK